MFRTIKKCKYFEIFFETILKHGKRPKFFELYFAENV